MKQYTTDKKSEKNSLSKCLKSLLGECSYKSAFFTFSSWKLYKSNKENVKNVQSSSLVEFDYIYNPQISKIHVNTVQKTNTQTKQYHAGTLMCGRKEKFFSEMEKKKDLHLLSERFYCEN